MDYLGCAVDWVDEDGDGPVYMLIAIDDVAALHAELHARGYPFLNPGLEAGPAGGREMQLIDPASNRLRCFESASRGS